MSYNPLNPNGQATMANSQPVVLSSNQSAVSVAGMVGSSIIGLPPVNVTNTNLNVSGSVASWLNSSNASVITVGSPVANQSVSGNVGISGNVTVVSSIAGGIFPISGSVAAVVTNFPTTQNISGSVVSQQIGTVITSVSGQVTVVSSLAGGIFPISGSVAAVVTNNVTVVSSLAGGIFPVSGSVSAVVTNTNLNISGSVAAFNMSTNASFISLSKDSSVIAILSAPSIVGTYVEDTAHATGDRGVFVLKVRNDTMSSVTSADGDYSPDAVGPTGETIVANSPITKWVQGTASMLGGTPLNGGSVAVIAAQGASIFTYITGIQVVNAGAANVFLRFDGGTSSTVGFTIAPATGGSNIVFPNALKTNANAAFTASVSALGSSIYISAQGFISKT